MNPSQQFTEEDYAIMVKFFEHSLDQPVLQRFEKRLEDDPKFAAEVDRVSKIWHSSTLASLKLEINAEAAFQHVKSRIAAEGKEKVHPSVNHRRRQMNIMIKVAAVFLLMVLAFTGYDYYAHSVIIVQAEHRVHRIQLPDGSNLVLGKGSEVSYARNFRSTKRRVSLKGKAFFQVEHDANRPFVVNTIASTVEVLGTEFEVSSDSMETSVSVRSGSVALASSNSARQIILEKGETGYFDPISDQLSQKSTTPIAFDFWATGKLTFTNNKLSEIITELNHLFDKNIRLKNPGLGNCRVNTSFIKPSLDEILDELQHLFNLEVAKDGDTVVINGNSCK